MATPERLQVTNDRVEVPALELGSEGVDATGGILEVVGEAALPLITQLVGRLAHGVSHHAQSLGRARSLLVELRCSGVADDPTETGRGSLTALLFLPSLRCLALLHVRRLGGLGDSTSCSAFRS